MASAAGCINVQWNGAETGSATARLAPISLASSIARSIAPLWPEITTWLGSLSLATSHTSPCAAASAIFCASSRSAPSSAAIAPTPTGTACCIAWPRSFSSFAVVARSNVPAAHNAEYSPRLWPATKLATSGRGNASVRNTASELAMIAGCAFSVSLSSSSGPSLISRNRFWPSASSTSANTSFAARLASANAAPMPTAWLPCPGKMNARIVAPVQLSTGGATRPTRRTCQARGTKDGDRHCAAGRFDRARNQAG